MALARTCLGAARGFRDSPGPVLDQLVAAGQVRALGRGEFAVRRGDPGDTVLMVVSGVMESSVLHLDGSRHLVGLAMPGDFFGLIVLADRGDQVHDLIARQDATVLAISTVDFLALRGREPSLVLACERHLAHRTRLLFERLAADANVPLKSRVARSLLTLGELYGRPRTGTGALAINVSQTDLADWLGMSRQRVNFVLRRLAEERLIEPGYHAIVIVDPQGLAACATA
jgi:CRP-like cAMP-binding protein